jgi:hypothetical protein
MIKNIFLLFWVISIFSACSNNANEGNEALGVLEKEGNRGANKNAESYKLTPSDFIELESKGKTKEAKLFLESLVPDSSGAVDLDIAEGPVLHLQETEIDDDMLVFGLESETEKKMLLEFISEDGQHHKATQIIKIPTALVFKAIKLEKMKSGTYYFKLTDESSGKALIRKIAVSHIKS